MGMQKEIELLRTEMLQLYSEITQYSCLLYTVVVALLAYSFKTDNYLVCMLPYLVIYPVFFLCEGKKVSICRISAYTYVFSDTLDYHWPKRMVAFDRIKEDRTHIAYKIRLMIQHMQYYMLVLACYALATYKIINSNYGFQGKLRSVFFVGIVTLVTIAVFIFNTVSTSDLREFYITIWNSVKAEENKKYTSNDNSERVSCS